MNATPPLVVAAEEATDGAIDVEAVPVPPVREAAGVTELFSQLSVERTAQGDLRIGAPPEASASLAALFEGLASLMTQVARK